jgi:hypothetical protein
MSEKKPLAEKLGQNEEKARACVANYEKDAGKHQQAIK